jgi:hypothetical protein
MGQADFLRVGDYNAICDVCGRKFKFSRLRQKWDNTWACEQDWEPRQPQDYLKGIKDNMSVPLSRPDPPNLFIQDEIVTEIPIISLILSIFSQMIALHILHCNSVIFQSPYLYLLILILDISKFKRFI